MRLLITIRKIFVPKHFCKFNHNLVVTPVKGGGFRYTYHCTCGKSIHILHNENKEL